MADMIVFIVERKIGKIPMNSLGLCWRFIFKHMSQIKIDRASVCCINRIYVVPIDGQDVYIFLSKKKFWNISLILLVILLVFVFLSIWAK